MEEIHNTIYKIHVANTINRPLCYHKFKMIDMDPQEVKDIDVTKCFQWVFKKYSNTDIGNNQTSIYKDPGMWINIFLDSVEKSKQIDSDYIFIPNGYSNTPYCPLKLFYELVYSYFYNIEKYGKELFENIDIEKLSNTDYTYIQENRYSDNNQDLEDSSLDDY
mgnify:CR=1 FL=1